jgi:hypothetical protein
MWDPCSKAHKPLAVVDQTDFQDTNPNIHLGPTVASLYLHVILAELLLKNLIPLVGSTNSFVKNSEHLVQLTKEINLQNGDSLICFEAVSLFTKLPA